MFAASGTIPAPDRCVSRKAPIYPDTQHVLDRGRKSENRYGQEKARPEPLLEIRHHLTVIVPGVSVMTRVCAICGVTVHIVAGVVESVHRHLPRMYMILRRA
jgi:hypothetical protein